MKTRLERAQIKIGLAVVLTVVALCVVFVHRLLADLTATVQPGYTYAANERPTTSTLNRLGRPTVTISGTLSGTNVALSVNSVSGDQLMDSVAGSNLTWDASSPRRLVITNGGVNVNQINTNVPGTGLTGGGGERLTVTNLPVARITVTSNYVIVGTGGDVGSLVPLSTNLTTTSGSLDVNITNLVRTLLASSNFTFATAEYTLSATTIINTNHGLAGTPSYVRWVLVCQTAEQGYEVGDEIAIDGPEGTSGYSYSIGANSTNVFATLASVGATISFLHRDTGAGISITRTRWKAKGYARL